MSKNLKESSITIDYARSEVRVDHAEGQLSHPLGTPEAFALISRAWLRTGWDNKYVYSFTWLGRPLIQLPEDVLRIQELIFSLRPDVIIETGVAHGGSLVLYASLLKAMGCGRVVGVDIEIRPHNRTAIEQHLLSPMITLIEGSSTAPETVAKVHGQVRPGEKVLVLLDSNHSCEHVQAELRLYSPLVAVGSYIVAMDGIMADVVGAPRTQPDWSWNNPVTAVQAFVRDNPGFVVEEPAFLFNEGGVRERVTYWPSAFIKRIG